LCEIAFRISCPRMPPTTAQTGESSLRPVAASSLREGGREGGRIGEGSVGNHTNGLLFSPTRSLSPSLPPSLPLSFLPYHNSSSLKNPSSNPFSAMAALLSDTNTAISPLLAEGERRPPCFSSQRPRTEGGREGGREGGVRLCSLAQTQQPLLLSLRERGGHRFSPHKVLGLMEGGREGVR